MLSRSIIKTADPIKREKLSSVITDYAYLSATLKYCYSLTLKKSGNWYFERIYSFQKIILRKLKYGNLIIYSKLCNGFVGNNVKRKIMNFKLQKWNERDGFD